MNDLSIETLIALYEMANVRVNINDGEIVSMFFEGGNDNE